MALIDTTKPINLAGATITAFPYNALAITKSDVDTFEEPVTIYVGIGGTVTVTPAGGQADVQFTVPTGGFVPCLVTAVKFTGTAASGFVAVY